MSQAVNKAHKDKGIICVKNVLVFGCVSLALTKMLFILLEVLPKYISTIESFCYYLLFFSSLKK